MLLSCTACVCGYAVLLFPVCVYTGLFHAFMHMLCVCVCVCVYVRVCVCVHYLVLRKGDVELVLLSITIVLQCINSTNAY